MVLVYQWIYSKSYVGGKGWFVVLRKKHNIQSLAFCLSAKQPLFCSFDFVWFLSTTIVQGVLVALFSKLCNPPLLATILVAKWGFLN